MNPFKELFNNVVAELNTDYNTIENATKIFKQAIYYDDIHKHHSWRYNTYGYGGSITMVRLVEGWLNRFRCIFGLYYFEEHKESRLIKKEKNSERDSCPYVKRGIEVIGMKPKRTSDGKYTYKGLTINDLKIACKKNGVKGISKMDKCQLVKALMNL